MKLNELLGVKAYKKGSLITIRNIMISFGFKKIGVGGNSYIFEYTSNPNLVVKVYYSSDNGFRKFLEYCYLNSDNICLPKFKGKSIKINNTLRMIRIEKLKELPEFQWNKIADYRSFNFDSEKILKICSFEDENLFSTLDDLESIHDLDLHEDNLMMRGNQIVIIDPWPPWTK